MENKISNQQIAAKRYIEENDIEKINSEMLNSLVHEKSKSPIVYMIKYLAGLLTEDERKANNLVIPEPYPKGKPIVKFPSLSDKNNSLLKKHLSKTIWSMLKYNKTKYNGTIMDLIKIGEVDNNSKVGVALTDYDCLEQFSNLLEPIIQETHNLIDKGNNIVIKHSYSVGKNKITENLEQNLSNYNIINFPFQRNINGSIKSLRVEFSRNLEDFPFSNIITKEKRESISKNIKAALSTLSSEEPILKKGKYVSLSSSKESELTDILKEFNINFDDMNNYMISANMNSSWPEHRGFYISENKELLILVNFIDHIKFIYRVSYINDFVDIFERAFSIVKSFERIINFEISNNYGYITCCPSLLGAGMEVFASISLKTLTSNNNNNITENDKLISILNKLKFDNYKINANNSLLNLNSRFKLKYYSELEFIKSFYQKLSALVILDDDKNKLQTLSFDRKEFEDEVGETYMTYFTSYDNYENLISPSGSTINSILINDLSYENIFGCFLFKEICDIYYFRDLLINYFKYSQKVDLKNKNNLNYFNITDEDFNFNSLNNENGKIVKLRISLNRNLENVNFTCSRFSDNNDSFNQLNEFLTGNDFLSNIEMIDSNEYISKLQSTELSDENNHTAIAIHSALNKNSSNLYVGGIGNIGGNNNNNKNRESSVFSKLSNLVRFDTTNRKIVKFDYKELKDILIFINDLNHFRLEYLLSNKSIKENNLKKILKLIGEISQRVNFAFDDMFGYYNPLPKFFGSGLNVKIGFNLSKYDLVNKGFKEICNKYNFSDFIKESDGLYYTNKISVIGVNEVKEIKDSINFMNEIVALDDKEISNDNKKIDIISDEINRNHSGEFSENISNKDLEKVDNDESNAESNLFKSSNLQSNLSNINKENDKHKLEFSEEESQNN